MILRPRSARTLLAAVLGFVLVSAVLAQTAGRPRPLKPAPGNKCPVCGMFVAEHMDFLAEIVFTDGACAFFDGAKDMFRFYFDMGAYVPSRTVSDIAAIYVTDYYTLEMIDARKASYVIGSDVLGPMGRELIPVAGEADAAVFLKDHKGKAVLNFGDITAKTLKDID